MYGSMGWQPVGLAERPFIGSSLAKKLFFNLLDETGGTVTEYYQGYIFIP